MKYAILSDIHGNAPSLRLALADAAAQGAQGYLLAGDYCISAPWADEVVTLLRQLPDAHYIRGNDEQHLDVPPGDDGQFAVSRWCAASLSPDNRAWLDALPETLDIPCEGVTIHMAHSSQAFVGKALHNHFRTSQMPQRYPDHQATREELLHDFRALWEDDAFRTSVEALKPDVYVFGHNHVQAWGNFDGRVLINPGSCGMPLDCSDFGACYTLLTIESGQITVEERRIPYDVEALIAQVKTTGQYQAAPIWSETIFSEWRTRREKVYYVLWNAEHYANSIGDTRRPFAKDTWQAAYEIWLHNGRQEHPELFIG